MLSAHRTSESGGEDVLRPATITIKSRERYKRNSCRSFRETDERHSISASHKLRLAFLARQQKATAWLLVNDLARQHRRQHDRAPIQASHTQRGLRCQYSLIARSPCR